jgi:hypothetical protein
MYKKCKAAAAATDDEFEPVNIQQFLKAFFGSRFNM